MTKESIYELQKIDCNCNDCGYMVRDFEAFEQSVERHNLWQFELFEIHKKKLIEKAEEWANRGEFEKATTIRNEANNMRFLFNKSECRINFGTCSLFKKPVSFISGTLQLETQKCFVHRKDWAS